MARADADDRRYNENMARLLEGRGHLTLAQAHRLAAQDCPTSCGCKGCATTRAEAAEARRGAKRKVAA